MSGQGGAPAGGVLIGGQAGAPDQHMAPDVTEGRTAEMPERGVLAGGEGIRAAVWGLTGSSRGMPRGRQDSINIVGRMLALDRRAGPGRRGRQA